MNVLSFEPARRSIELAFLHRINEAAKETSVTLDKATQVKDDSFSTHLACMQNPVFKRIARELEQSIPDTGFGPFRGRS